MKRKFTLLSLFVLSIFSSTTYALDLPGYVYVTHGSTYSYMYGSFNVGTNPRTGHENSYISAYHAPGWGIYISGRDGTDNETLSCTFFEGVSDPFYDKVRNMVSGISDGAYLYVRKQANGDCDYVYVAKPSYFQD